MPHALYPRSQGSQTGSENCHVSNTQNHKPGIRAQLGLCCMYLHVCVRAHMCGPTCIHVHVCVCSQLHGNLPGAGQGRHGGKIYSRPGELGDRCPCLLTQPWEFGRMTSSTLILRCPWYMGTSYLIWVAGLQVSFVAWRVASLQSRGCHSNNDLCRPQFLSTEPPGLEGQQFRQRVIEGQLGEVSQTS